MRVKLAILLLLLAAGACRGRAAPEAPFEVVAGIYPSAAPVLGQWHLELVVENRTASNGAKPLGATARAVLTLDSIASHPRAQAADSAMAYGVLTGEIAAVLSAEPPNRQVEARLDLAARRRGQPAVPSQFSAVIGLGGADRGEIALRGTIETADAISGQWRQIYFAGGPGGSFRMRRIAAPD